MTYAMLTSKEAEDAILSAVEERKLMLERKLVTTPPECRAEIVEDIEACGSLLVKIRRELFRRLDDRTTVH
jgi:hypothetical protein